MGGRTDDNVAGVGGRTDNNGQSAFCTELKFIFLIAKHTVLMRYFKWDTEYIRLYSILLFY